MSELTNVNLEENAGNEGQNEISGQSFQEMLDKTFTSLHTGKIVKGQVVSVTNTEVIVDLGYKSDGIITRSEFSDDPGINLHERAKPGDEFDVFVLRVNDGDGNVLVSKKKVDNQLNYRQLEQAFNEKTPLSGKVTDVVKGGLVANILGCRAFIPASQISSRFEHDLESFKGKEFDFNILEFDRSKRRIVAGRKELATQEAQAKRDEVFSRLQVGQKVEGTVCRLVDFGAFVDIGGVDGLVHVTEVSWKRIRRPSDVLSAGDKVLATVIGIDTEKGKVSLSLRDADKNPWNNIMERYPINGIVDGTVVRLAPFGAFVSLEEGLDGLVHISQIAERHIAKPDEELKPGQVIQVMVIDVDIENQRISLSKRDADAILFPSYDDDEDAEYEDVEEASETAFEEDNA